ncbi:MAG: nitrogenase molybdenum-iron protein alpha chain, partial [Nitrospirae bacterium]|nr:nitrogenase molybdenum-iron protein alpha chain [Nitrospirota bacterium]
MSTDVKEKDTKEAKPVSRKIKETQKMIEEVLSAYPEKSKKERAKHLAANDPTGQCSSCQVKANVKSRPGVMTVRGCAYAGAKGVVWGPVKDQITISHGPIGCGQYSWWSRRNYYNGQTGIDAFGTMHITTDFQEKNIVYGGDKGLDLAIKELHGLFPLGRGIGILSECPVGLIGDDIEAVSKRVSKELKIPIVPVRCEGFRGVSQSLGHHIANDTIKDYVLGKGTLEKTTPYDVNLIGDYNIGGDAWASRK